MNSALAEIAGDLHHHLANKGIKNIQDLQMQLQKIFDESDHQNSVLIELYKMLFPDWEKIKKIQGFPEVGQGLWDYIFNLFVEFDGKHHPKRVKGGTWIIHGFRSNCELDPWQINLKNCKIIYSKCICSKRTASQKANKQTE